MHRGPLLAVLLVLATVAPASEIPFLAGRVNDDAGILSTETINELDRLLKIHEDSTSNQVAVLTLRTLEGESIESFSMRVVDSWKLGKKGKDNGILLLVVSEDRKVRIEVGRGLEGDLPDITCGIIIRKEILPRFKAGEYDAGVTAGVRAILGVIGGSYKAEPAAADSPDALPIVLGSLIFFVVVGIFTVIGVMSKGAASWFLYVFLMPFWSGFPIAMYGMTAGLTMFGLFAVGFPVLKSWFARSGAGRSFQDRWAKKAGLWSTGAGGWSSGSSGFSSGGGGFSGGGGGFSGGGASGSW